MVHRNSYSRLSTRIAEEKQLLAEEKWIIEALTKIRNQRNCLQIERLELESMKSQLIMNSRTMSSLHQPGSSKTSSIDSAVQLMSNPAGAVLQELEAALAKDLEQENLCNEQKLDLTVSNPILSLSVKDRSVEEVEEDSDGSDDFHDGNNSLLIDMNMFMNGNNPS